MTAEVPRSADATERTPTSDTTPAGPEGIDAPAVTAWFEQHVAGVTPPLNFTLIAGGHSNLTYAVDDVASRRWVLRRPPLGQVLASAHDMRREHTIISALGPTDVPVPATIGLCTDESVNGAPFYVMDFVEGSVVRTVADAESLTLDQRRTAGESLVDVLAGIHAVDVDGVGLGQLGKKEGYIARQLKRWNSQYEASESQVEGGLDLPAVAEVHARLSAAIPPQGPATIVHGDYRLDNCLLSPDGTVAAVLDWELCTLGDPLADLGLLCVYWAEPGENPALPEAAPTALEGFPSREAMVERYAATSGRDVSDLPFYVTFGYWKLTCIIAGVYARYAGGAMGETSEGLVRSFRDVLDSLAEATAAAAEEL